MFCIAADSDCLVLPRMIIQTPACGVAKYAIEHVTSRVKTISLDRRIDIHVAAHKNRAIVLTGRGCLNYAYYAQERKTYVVWSVFNSSGVDRNICNNDVAILGAKRNI